MILCGWGTGGEIGESRPKKNRKWGRSKPAVPRRDARWGEGTGGGTMS